MFAGFAAALPLFDDDGSVAGVQIGDMGVQHDGSRGPNFTPGPEVRARLTVIAEGCRGSLAKVLIQPLPARREHAIRRSTRSA